MDGRISNPNGAFGQTAGDGNVDRATMTVFTTTAVSAGDVVCWVTLTTDVIPTVKISVQGTDDPASVAGVALEAASANTSVLICRNGPAKVNIGTGSVAAWNRCILLAGTNGAADDVTADANTIDGDTFGTWLGAEIGTTNQAWADIRCG